MPEKVAAFHSACQRDHSVRSPISPTRPCSREWTDDNGQPLCDWHSACPAGSVCRISMTAGSDAVTAPESSRVSGKCDFERHSVSAGKSQHDHVNHKHRAPGEALCSPWALRRQVSHDRNSDWHQTGIRRHPAVHRRRQGFRQRVRPHRWTQVRR